MDIKQYKEYSVEDFILDDEFRNIVKSEESKLLVEELLDQIPEKKDEINLAVYTLQSLHTESFRQNESKKQKQWQEIIQTKQKKLNVAYYLKIAASVILVVGLAGIIIYLKFQKQPDEIVLAPKTESNDARLILANGESVNISSQQSTVQYKADGSGIIVDDTSEVVQAVSDEALNELIVPYGKRSYIELSEGTKVWLNSGSRLVFPPVFRKETREVYIEGEALFEVAKDTQKPFFAKTGLFKIKVYGTKFNIQAYQQDNKYNVVLVEGSVSMNADEGPGSQEVFLAPGQKASIIKGEHTFDIKNVENTDVYTAWTDGYLTFINEDVSEVLKRVSRYYNTHIACNLPENFEKIYGKLDLKTDVARVLDGIAFISNTTYKIQGDEYVFMKK